MVGEKGEGGRERGDEFSIFLSTAGRQFSIYNQFPMFSENDVVKTR